MSEGGALHIVYLSPSGQLGGAETSLRELMAGLRACCPDWKLFLVLGQDGPLAKIARDQGVDVMVVPFPAAIARLGESNQHRAATVWSCLSSSWAIWSYWRRLRRVLQSIRPDIIHSNGLKMHLFGAWTRPAGARLVWHIHDYVGARPLTRHLLPCFQSKCDTAIVNSNSVGRDLRSFAKQLNVVTVYNAVDLNRFSPEGARLDLDKLAGLPPASPATVRVGLVATFATWKGHQVCLKALARISPEVPIRGYIVGGPIYETEASQLKLDALKEQVARDGLTGKIGFTGFLADTAAAMRSLDIVVHASTRPEPFGMVIIEGMACGKAVIASQAGGAAELFIDGETALAHAPGDAEGLARQIERLSRDKALRNALGKSGRSEAERSYGTQRLVQELMSVYRGRPPSARRNSTATSDPIFLSGGRRVT
jgi:glycosyltransferase involved in cell wall biosynthesis